MNLKYAIEEVEALKDAVSENTVFGKVLKLSQILEGLPKAISTHAVGIALSREAITGYSPLYKLEDNSVICTQYTADRLAELGPVKVDFLGFKVLTLLHHCQNEIRVKNPEFRLSQIPDDDEPAFLLLGEVNTTGVFQCESSGMKDILKEAKPQSIEELAALNALYRPGAMDLVPKYIEAKNKGRCDQYPPEISDILAPTYGIIIYQEQIMKIAHVVAGWSYGKGDILRRNLTKSDAKGGRNLKSSFIDDVIRNGYSEKKAEEIFEHMVDAAPCLALKAHSICYALLAYRSAYLKANYPQEYKESCLYLERHNPSRYKDYLEEAAETGIKWYGS
jgi:DNA polymerase-3 subunit alpha